MIELALAATFAAESAEAKLHAAEKSKKVGAGNTATSERERVRQAQQAGVLTVEEAELITRL